MKELKILSSRYPNVDTLIKENIDIPKYWDGKILINLPRIDAVHEYDYCDLLTWFFSCYALMRKNFDYDLPAVEKQSIAHFGEVRLYFDIATKLLQCIMIQEKADDELVRFIFSEMANIGMYKDLYIQIKDIFGGKSKSGLYPVYPDLYIRIGDRVLFHEHNVELALKFYELTIFYALFSAESRPPLEDYFSIVSCAYHYYLPKSFESYLKFMTKDDLSELPDLFKRLEQIEKEYKDGCDFKKLIDSTNNIIELLENRYFDSPEKKIQRNAVIMALGIRDYFLFEAISYLKNSDKNSQNKNAHNILRAIVGYFLNESDNPIYSYVLNTWNDYFVSNHLVASDFRIIKDLNDIEGIEFEFIHNLLYLVEVKLQSNKIKNNLLVDFDCRSLQKVAYYTSFSSLSNMLWKQEVNDRVGIFPIMNVSYMNDPSEGVVLSKYLFDRTANTSRRELRKPYVFLKSFTTQIDDIPMWEMYGDSGKGVCIVLNSSFHMRRPNKNPDSVPLYYICYMQKKGEGYCVEEEDNKALEAVISSIQKSLEIIKLNINNKIELLDYYLGLVSDIQYLFKDADYRHEMESRILYMYDNYNTDFHMTPVAVADNDRIQMLYVLPDFFPIIDEIIIGPKFDKTAKEIMMIQSSIDKLYISKKLDLPSITKSKVEYQ